MTLDEKGFKHKNNTCNTAINLFPPQISFKVFCLIKLQFCFCFSVQINKYHAFSPETH